MVTPSAKREAVGLLTGACGLPVQRVVATNHRWGFWICDDQLGNQGYRWNHKRVDRVYCALRLNLPRRTRKRVVRSVLHPLAAPSRLNHTWAIDFMTDTLDDGQRFRTRNVLDEGNREALAIDVGMSLPSGRVIAVLEELGELHGRGRALRLGPGPELTSIALTRGCAQHPIALHYIEPGKPQRNANTERFNRPYRTEVLDAYIFHSLAEVRALRAEWLVCYNTERLHDSLGRVPPLFFLPRLTTLPKSTYHRPI